MANEQPAFAPEVYGVPPAAECAALQPALSCYLDGELECSRAGALLRHLEQCGPCAQLLEQYRTLGLQLRQASTGQPPADMALRLRVKASHYSVRGQYWEYWRLRLLSAFQALALPAAVGTAAAVFLFTALAGGVQMGAVNSHLPDVQVGMEAQPPTLARISNYGVGGPLLVEAQIDSTGHVYGYSVISGVLNAQLLSRLNNQLLMSVFEPATTNFGKATNGSLLVAFGTVDVRG